MGEKLHEGKNRIEEGGGEMKGERLILILSIGYTVSSSPTRVHTPALHTPDTNYLGTRFFEFFLQILLCFEFLYWVEF